MQEVGLVLALARGDWGRAWDATTAKETTTKTTTTTQAAASLHVRRLGRAERCRAAISI